MENDIYINRSRMNRIIVYLVYLTIFVNSFVFFKAPFEFYLGYLVYLALLPVFLIRYGINRNMFFIFSILLITGIVNIILGNDTASQFIKVFIGLVLAYQFYYYVMLEFELDIYHLFKWYLIGAYIVAIIGIVQLISFAIHFQPGYNFHWILNKWGIAPGGFWGLRINSVFSEPTHLAATLAPAFFISLYNLFVREPFFISKFKSVTIVVVYLLSFSGLGQLGIFLSLLLFAVNFGLVRYALILVPITIVLFNYLYNNVPEFHERFTGIVDLYSGKEYKIGEIHGSSFILYNNYTVAMKNFLENPLFGSGIGSHLIAFEKYSLAKGVIIEGINSNGQDANSMFLRLMSETGLFGLGIFFIIIVKCFVRRDENHETHHWLISNGVLILILLNLFRQGHYFLNGFPFFMCLYYYNHLDYKKYLASKEPEPEVPETA